MVVIVAIMYLPAPTETPIDATVHKVAAVVNPTTFSVVFTMVPAPRNPTPTMMDAATLAGSDPRNACKDKIVRRVEAKPTRMCVLKPAGLRLTSLSSPTAPLSTKPRKSLAASSNSDVMLLSCVYCCIYV